MGETEATGRFCAKQSTRTVSGLAAAELPG